MSRAIYSFRQARRDWWQDVEAFVHHGLSPRRGWRRRVQLISATAMPPVLCCLCYRLGRWSYTHGWERCAASFRWLNQLCFGASISPSSELGPGLYIPHPAAVVVDATAGPGLRVYAGASLYRALEALQPPGDDSCRPVLGRGVVVGAKAAVSGPVQIGDDAVISFNAVVRRDVPPGASVLQSPLRNYKVGRTLRPATP